MKLSKRLKKIEQMVIQDYTHIWDCCCDHGFLGAALLNRQSAETIHFVDIVPELMATLESKLKQFYNSPPYLDNSWQTHCLDVAELPLNKYKGKHLVIIAGVGGDLMIRFIEALYAKYLSEHGKVLNIDFLLCPVHHQFSLRQKLIALDFGLKEEALVAENKRFYEIIYVSSSKQNTLKIDPVGADIWKYNSDQQAKVVKQYLDKTLKHYGRVLEGQNTQAEVADNSSNVQKIIDAYQKVSL